MLFFGSDCKKNDLEYAVYFKKLNDKTAYWFGDDSRLHIAKGKARVFKSSEDAYVNIARFLMYNVLFADLKSLCDFHVVVI